MKFGLLSFFQHDRRTPAQKISDEITTTTTQIMDMIKNNNVFTCSGYRRPYPHKDAVMWVESVISALNADRSIAKISHEVWHMPYYNGLKEKVALLTGLVLQYYGLTYGSYFNAETNYTSVMEMKYRLSEFIVDLNHEFPRLMPASKKRA